MESSNMYKQAHAHLSAIARMNDQLADAGTLVVQNQEIRKHLRELEVIINMMHDEILFHE